MKIIKVKPATKSATPMYFGSPLMINKDGVLVPNYTPNPFEAGTVIEGQEEETLKELPLKRYYLELVNPYAEAFMIDHKGFYAKVYNTRYKKSGEVVEYHKSAHTVTILYPGKTPVQDTHDIDALAMLIYKGVIEKEGYLN